MRVGSRSRRAAVAVAFGVLLVAEFAAMPFDVVPRVLEIPPVDRWLAGRQEVRAIAELPEPNPANLSRSERWHTTYMLHSTAHWKKTVDGYSGIRTSLHEAVVREARRVPRHG